jgi:hypothetical protein
MTLVPAIGTFSTSAPSFTASAAAPMAAILVNGVS